MSISPSSTRLRPKNSERFSERGLTGHPQLWEIDQNVIRAELRLWYDEEILDALARSSDRAAFEVTYGMPLDADSPPLSRSEPVPLMVNGRRARVERTHRPSAVERGRRRGSW